MDLNVKGFFWTAAGILWIYLFIPGGGVDMRGCVREDWMC